ncbi:extracellular solute-binding protein [Rubrobacter tropicus]|uniref:Extracellular solute-binding protein n=1 Tax=Rubrobacter tropicus TaxID=2653851 RepID=A0A6G8Q538_9ACTN|nr:extracellular solute-binding protein [Rubrobacter tropicus]
MQNTLTRKQVLKGGGAVLAGLYASGLLAGCAGSGAGGTQMRMTWWGSTVRHERTREALKLFEKNNSGVKITPEPIGDFDEYWNKLATQASGGNAPDVIQTDYRYLTEYAGRGVLMELDEYIPDEINLQNFDRGQIENGQIDGKTYALSFGDNAQIVAYDVARFEDAGMEPRTTPGPGTTSPGPPGSSRGQAGKSSTGSRTRVVWSPCSRSSPSRGARASTTAPASASTRRPTGSG